MSNQQNLFPPPRSVIGVSGMAGSGKDTLVGYIKEELTARGVCVAVIGFADSIREVTHHVGLNVFSREQKEVVASIFDEDIDGAIIAALDEVLGLETEQVWPHLHRLLDKGGHLAYGETGDCLNISPRRFAQLLGDAGKAAHGENYWCQKYAGRVVSSCAEVVLTPDLRFPQELNFIHHAIYVYRDGVAPVIGHNSESHFYKLRQSSRWFVDNSSDLGRLRENAINIAKEL